MIVYNNLWLLLKRKNMKRTDLLEVISAPTLAKLGKNESVSVSIIEKVCEFLDCQPGEIMTYEKEVTKEEVIEQLKTLGDMQRVMMDMLKEKGISSETLIAEMQKEVPEYMQKLFNNENPYSAIIEKLISEKNTQ